MLRGIMIFLLAGAIGLLAGGNAWAKPKTEAGQSTVTANSKTSAKKTVKGKSKLKAAKGTVHVHVLRSTGKSATAATVTIKSGHHKVVRRADRAGRATISIAGHKSAKVKARNNHGAHGSVKTAIAAGMHSSVTVSLHGGRAAAATTGHHHKRHHAHQSKNLGTASGKAAKKTAGHATATPAPAAKPLGVALPAGAK